MAGTLVGVPVGLIHKSKHDKIRTRKEPFLCNDKKPRGTLKTGYDLAIGYGCQVCSRADLAWNIEDWIRSGDWVEEQLRISLQLLASEGQKQINHYPSGVDIIGELVMDYEHYSSAIRTYWEIPPYQAAQLRVLVDFFYRLDNPSTSDFWTVQALNSDPRWDEARSIAKQALHSLNWPVEIPLPEKGSIGWRLMQRET